MVLYEKIIFDRIIDIREKFDESQQEFAKRFSVGQTTYSKWETSSIIIPLYHLNTLCNISGYSMDYILGLTDINIPTKNINSIDVQELGKRYKMIRKKAGYTQIEDSEYLNTTQSTISGYENGTTLMLTQFAYAIAKRYNVSVDWLCGRKDEIKT